MIFNKNIETGVSLPQFVGIKAGEVLLGTKYPLPCKTTGYRVNETPVHSASCNSFWIAKTCITNAEFERFNPKHLRTSTSCDDRSPVTEVTYTEAVEYADWLSQETGANFDLPTEEEWSIAASPYGWEYPHKRGPKPRAGFANTHSLKVHSTINVDDDRFGTGHNGLFHMSGNVCEIVKGVHEAPGSSGFASDGHYCIIKGGDFGHCDFSTRVCTRGIFDIASRSTRVGFRLVMHQH